MVARRLAVSNETWTALVTANRRAVAAGWADPGVFAAGIGPDYKPGGLLYVGKSAGPLGSKVGSTYDQRASSDASTEWMISLQNQSAFWQFVKPFDPDRASLAWTNVCKMDRKGGGRPPSGAAWNSVATSCLAALAEEITNLSPGLVLFAISDCYRSEVLVLLNRLGYRLTAADLSADGCTRTCADAGGRAAILTRHPQGWPNSRREPVVALARRLLNRQPHG